MTAISKIIAKNQISNGGPSRFIIAWIGLPSMITLYLPVILVQAENEYSASAANNIYMQAIIDLYRANGIVVREYCIFLAQASSTYRQFIAIIHNDQHAGQAGNFSPDLPGTHVDIYWCDQSFSGFCCYWLSCLAETRILKERTVGPRFRQYTTLPIKQSHPTIHFALPRYFYTT